MSAPVFIESPKYLALLHRAIGAARESSFEEEVRGLLTCNDAAWKERHLRRLEKYLAESVAALQYCVKDAHARRRPAPELERLRLKTELQETRLSGIRQLLAA